MKNILTKFALALGVVPVVWAACAPDFEGLSGLNAFDQSASTSYSGLPNGYVDAAGARTTDDYVNAVANQLFFTPEGSRFLEEVFHWAYGFPGFASRGYEDPKPIAISGYACNEIGQCRDTRTTVSFSGHRDSLFDAVIKFITVGLISGINVDFRPEAYTITATDSNGTVTDQRDFINGSIRRHATDQDLYDLSTDDMEDIDTDCRDNAGMLVTGTSGGNSGGTGGGADGGGTVDLDWDFDLDPQANEWTCWASDTGVVCKKGSK